MGFSRSPLHGLSLAAAFAAALAFLCSSRCLEANASEDAGASATLDSFILPEYHKSDNRLQCVIYGQKAVNQGAFITLRNPLLDIVHDNIKDINAVSNMQGVKLYPIDLPTDGVRVFWKGKEHSRALVSSPSAVYDRTTKMLRGDESVLFRSPGMDIDGVGFDANDETRFIHIRSNVRVIVRPEMRKEVEGRKASEARSAEEAKGKDSVK